MNTTENDFELPATLWPSRLREALLFVASLALVAIAIWVVRRVPAFGYVSGGRAFGYVCAGFFGLGLPLAVIQFFHRLFYLRLTTEGFTVAGLFLTVTTRWEHVGEFAVVFLPPLGGRMVGYNYTDEYTGRRRLGAFNHGLIGREAALPNIFAMRPRELADLMNSLAREYGRPLPVPPPIQR